MTPFGCAPSDARLLSSEKLGGSDVVTMPCDWWWTQKNSLQPSPCEHQLWLEKLAFSMIRKVLLVPSSTSFIFTALLTQPMPLYAPAVPVWRRSGQQFSFNSRP